jgi:hypothetical protein
LLAQNAKLSFGFITTVGGFDFDLADPLADLEHTLRAEYPLFSRLEVMVFPSGQLHRFVAERSFAEVFPTAADWMNAQA